MVTKGNMNYFLESKSKLNHKNCLFHRIMSRVKLIGRPCLKQPIRCLETNLSHMDTTNNDDHLH